MKDENKNLVQGLKNFPEMSIKEYNSIPFNNKITFSEGIICRQHGSSFGIGQLATYWKCGSFPNGSPKLKPIQVWLIE